MLSRFLPLYQSGHPCGDCAHAIDEYVAPRCGDGEPTVHPAHCARGREEFYNRERCNEFDLQCGV